MGNNGSRNRKDKRSRNGRRNSRNRRRVRDPYCCDFDRRPNPYCRPRCPTRYCDDEVEVCDTVCEPIRPVDLDCYVPRCEERCYVPRCEERCYVPPPPPPVCFNPYNQYASSQQVVYDYLYPQFEYPYTGYKCRTRCSTYPTFASPTSYRC